MVSVIIPIYNVKRFLMQGLQQVLQQTYTDFEILIVDDGSTDGSHEMCKILANSDSRISVVYHQENQGLGIARNSGIEHARGEFIYFFDIDDNISPTLLEYNVRMMEERNVDMIVFGYKSVETTYKSEVLVTFPEKIISSNSELRNTFVDSFVMKTNGFAWNKFYRKAFLDRHDLRYENQRIQQDEVFNLKCYQYVQRMYISPEVLYTYYVYEKGNIRSHFIANRFDIYLSVRQHFENLKAFWHLKDARLDNYLNKRFYDSVMLCLAFNLTHPECPWTKKEKNKEMTRINNHALTQQAYVWAEKNDNSLEQRLLRKACQKGNLNYIKCLKTMFDTLHTIRKKLR